MAQKIVKLILPFSVPSSNRKEPFSKDMERATILCLAEAERSKGEGFVLKGPVEKLVFIAEVCYPLWLIPWRDTTLLFDGLGIVSHKLCYEVIPDVKSFVDGIQRSSETCEAYSAFLSSNLNYFRDSENMREKVVDGLVAEQELLQDFTLYLSEAKPVKAPIDDKVVLSPTIDESTVTSITEELQTLRTRFVEEVENLYKSMKLLNRATENFIKIIRSEIKEIEKSFGEKIEKCRALVSKKVEEIQREYDKKVTQLTRKIENQLYDLHQKRVKLEKTKEHLTSKIERCEAEIKTCALNKDSAGEQKWREESKKYRKELSTRESEIKEVDKKIKELEGIKKPEISKLMSECEAKVDKVTKELRDLEASRDAKVHVVGQKMETLEELTSSIISQIDKIVKQREATVEKINRLGLPMKRLKYALVYMPFYLVCYRSQSKTRYVLYPPSTVSSLSLSVKLKGIFGKAKIKQLLRPRSKTITSFLNKFPTLLERNAVFEKEIKDAGAKVNVLRRTDLRDSAMRGFEQLREEGWILDGEPVIEDVQNIV